VQLQTYIKEKDQNL